MGRPPGRRGLTRGALAATAVAALVAAGCTGGDGGRQGATTTVPTTVTGPPPGEAPERERPAHTDELEAGQASGPDAPRVAEVLPPGFPVPDGATVAGVAAGEEIEDPSGEQVTYDVLVSLVADRPPREVFAFYEAELPAAGYRVDGRSATGEDRDFLGRLEFAGPSAGVLAVAGADRGAFVQISLLP